MRDGVGAWHAIEVGELYFTLRVRLQLNSFSNISLQRIKCLLISVLERNNQMVENGEVGGSKNSPTTSVFEPTLPHTTIFDLLRPTIQKQQLLNPLFRVVVVGRIPQHQNNQDYSSK